MASHKVGRVTAAIRRLASHAIQHKMNDPRLGIVSITEIKLSPDLSQARIGISAVGTDSQKRTAFRAIESARGFIQKQVASGLRTKVAPRLMFYLDEAVDKALRIQELLLQTAREGGRLPEEDSDDESLEPEGDAAGEPA